MPAPEPECAVCFEPTGNIVRPCLHAVCPACIDRWMAKATTCPVCRGVLVSPRKHVGVPFAKQKGVHLTIVDFPRPDGHAGMTFKSAPQGLVVAAVHPADRAHACGLRRGDVVTLANGMALRDHAHAAQLLNRAAQTCEPVVLCVRRHRSSWARWMRQGAARLAGRT